MKRLVVIGGGVSGLAAAWEIRRNDRSTAIVVVEAGRDLGGRVRTTMDRGLLMEDGADAFFGYTASPRRVLDELGIVDRLRPQLPRSRDLYLAKDGVLTPVPQGVASSLVPADSPSLRQSTLLVESAKHRLLGEAGVPPSPGGRDESIAQFLTRRFGPEVFQTLLEPLLDGVFAGGAGSMSVAAALPHLRHLETTFGSLTKGVGAQDDERVPWASTFPHGMRELVTHLTRAVAPARIATGVRATRVERRAEGFLVALSDGSEVAADAVVVAVGAADAAQLLEPVDRSAAAALGDMTDVPAAVVHVCFDRANISNPLDGYGFLIPRSEGSDVVACAWQSQRWRGRAPRGQVLFRFIIGGQRGEGALRRDDSSLIHYAVLTARRFLGADGDPIHERVVRWERGVPRYDVGHLSRVHTVEERLAQYGGIALAGCSYHGPGVPDCIDSGRRAAWAISAALSA